MRRNPLTETAHTVAGRTEATLTRNGGAVTRGKQAGRALTKALPVYFCLWLFDITVYLKRYAGGLVVFDNWMSVYRLTSFGDDVSVSFTVWRTAV